MEKFRQFFKVITGKFSENSLFNELDYWQNTLPQNLLNRLDTQGYQEAVLELLNSILLRLDADRAGLVEYDHSTNTKSCICTNKLPHDQQKDSGGIMMLELPWLRTLLTEHKAVVINSADDLPLEALREKNMFADQGVASMIIVPMVNKQGVWGEFCVSSRSERTWSESEIICFNATAKIISIHLDQYSSNKAVKRERNYLKLLQKHMPVGLERYDHNGILITQNDMAMNMLGFKSIEDVQSRNISLFNNPFIPAYKREALRRGESIHCDFIYKDIPFSHGFYVNTDGRPKYIELYASALFNDNGDVTDYLTVLINSTEKRKINIKLFENKWIFDLISESSQIGYFTANIFDGKVEFHANGQWYKNMNIHRGTIKSLGDMVPGTVRPEDAQQMGKFLSDALINQSHEDSGEIGVKYGDDSYHWLQYHVRVVDFNPSEGRVVIAGVNIDITSQKEVEKTLNDAKKKAEESDKLVRAFLKNISHQVRTPLNAVVGFSGAIADAFKDNEELKEFVSIINSNNDLLLRLFEDAVNLSKIEAGVFEISLGQTDINRLCEEVIHTHSSRLRDNLTLTHQCGLAKCNISCDRDRILQVFYHLINNAIKFTENGSIKIGYNTLEDVGIRQIEFWVEDTGIGMTPEETELYFKPFNRVEDGSKPGFGLGLSICKAIVSQHGGTMGVSTQMGVGSRFWFRIPMMELDDKGMVIDDLTITTPDGRRPIVMIAEDMYINYRLISEILKPYCDVIIARNGMEAVQLHKDKSPDIILMDLKMPVLNGLEATSAIRRVDTQTPILAITAYSFDFNREEAINAGCNYMITKPINSTQLRKLIRNFVLNPEHKQKIRKMWLSDDSGRKPSVEVFS